MNRKDEIRQVAYELYERSGMIPGREVENWLKAEKIVMARYAEQAKTKTDAPPVKKAAAKTKTAGTASPKTGPVKAEQKKTGPRKK
jgi:hypothetical protein